MTVVFVFTFLLHTINSKNLLVELADKKASSSSAEHGSKLGSEASFEQFERKVAQSRAGGGGNDYMSVREASALGCKGEEFNQQKSDWIVF